MLLPLVTGASSMSFHLTFAEKEGKSFFARFVQSKQWVVYGSLHDVLNKNSEKITANGCVLLDFKDSVLAVQGVHFIFFSGHKEFKSFYTEFLEFDDIGKDKLKPGVKPELLRGYIVALCKRAQPDIVSSIEIRFSKPNLLLEPTWFTFEDIVQGKQHTFDAESYYINYIIGTSLSKAVVKIGYCDTNILGRLDQYLTCLPCAKLFGVILIPNCWKDVRRLDNDIKQKHELRRQRNLKQNLTEWLSYDDKVIEDYFSALDSTALQQKKLEIIEFFSNK